MTCRDCDGLLPDYADDVLPPGTAAHVEAHLVACLRCQALAADVRAIRSLARSLEPHRPPARIWQRLSDARRTERPWSLPATFAGWRPAAAAAMALTIAAGLWWVGDRFSSLTPGRAATRATPALAIHHDAAHRHAEGRYATTIASLEALTEASRDTLDPEIAGVLETGLTVIDAAIDQSRAALAAAPGSDAAQDSLFQALRSKVELLQDTLVLINDMRTSAARLTAEMNQPRALP